MERYRKDSIFKSRFEPALERIGLPFYLHSTGEYTSNKGHIFQTKGITSQFVELIWSISGIGEATLFDKKFQLGENDVFFYLPGEDHFRRTLSDTWKIRWLCIHGPLAESILLSFRYPRCQTPAAPFPEAAFREIEEIIVSSDPALMRRGCALVLDIFAQMGGEYGSGIHSEKTVRRCMELISANLSEPQLGLTMLSDTLGVPRSTLSKLFKEKTGISPGRYILNKRHVLAINLLQGSDLRISEVARQCGFSESRTFARFIKRATGLGPRDFRRHFNDPGPE